MQVMFNIVIYLYAGLKLNFVRDAEVNFALFFTVLLMHLMCVNTAKDGLTMMKYALLHPDEFTFPGSAFLLGFFAFSSLVYAEVINIILSQSKKTVIDAIAGLIGFKSIVDIPTMYMNSLEEFPAKGLVGKLECKRSRTERPK